MAQDAFISYSHEEDGLLAPVLQETLQRIGKPWYRRRALQVFRDETGLSANPGLWTSLTEVLDESEWFILLASPRAAASPWVNRELDYWLEHKDRTHLLLVLTRGDWTWEEASRDFDWDRSTAVPPALRGAFTEEPRHIDLRWAVDEPDITPRNARLRDQAAEIAAPIHGVTKDELEGTDLREHRRTVRLARGVGLVLVLLTVAATIGAVAASRNAREARANATQADTARRESDHQRIIAQSRDLRSKASALALLLAVEARHQRDSPQSQGAIQAALLANAGFMGRVVDGSAEGPYSDACPIDGGSTVVTTGSDGTFGFTDLDRGAVTGSRERLLEASAEVLVSGFPLSAIRCSTSEDGRAAVLFSSTGRVWVLDDSHSPRDAGHDLRAPLNDMAVSPDGAWLAAGTADGTLLVWRDGTDPADAQRWASDTDAVGVAFSPDGATLAATTSDEIVLWDTETWEPRRRIQDVAENQAGGLVPLDETYRLLAFSPDGRYLANSRRAIVRLIDVGTGTVRWHDTNDLVIATDFAWAPDSSAVFISDDTGRIDRRQTIDGAAVGPPIDGSAARVAAVLEDGSTLIAVDWASPAISGWALDGTSAISRFIPAPDGDPFGYSPDGRTLLVGPVGPSVVAATRAFDVATLTPIADVPEAAFPTLVDARTAAGFFIDELSVDRLDLTSGDRIGPRFGVDIVGAVQATNDASGRILVAHEDNRVRRYESDGTEVGQPWLRTDDFVVTMRLSPRGDLAAIDTLTGATVYRLSDASPAFDTLPKAISGDFSPDGSVIGVFHDDLFTFVDTATGKAIGPSSKTTGAYYESQMSSGPVFTLVGAGLTELHDRTSGNSIGDPFPTLSRSQLRPDGLELATASEDGVVLWDLDPDHWEAAACRLAGRNLTREEWSSYFPNGDTYRVTCPMHPSA